MENNYTIYLINGSPITASFNALTIENNYCSCICSDTEHQLLIPLTNIAYITDNTVHKAKPKSESFDASAS